MAGLLSPDLERHWQHTRGLLAGVEGHLTEQEARWLYAAAATCVAEGDIVEIGSFKGRSTIALARGIQAGGRGGRVVAVDPHSAPAETDPHLGGAASSEPELRANLARSGVADLVDVRVAYSQEAGAGWTAPIRLLWLDGDHTLDGVRADFDLWAPHLSEGGVLAMHDVLHRFEGPARVFLERLLRAPGWARAGFVRKSIGWAVKRGDADLTATPRTRLRAALLRRMLRLAPAEGRLGRARHNFCRTLLYHL
jgi:predicted O-methyltransferase YrrM